MQKCQKNLRLKEFIVISLNFLSSSPMQSKGQCKIFSIWKITTFFFSKGLFTTLFVKRRIFWIPQRLVSFQQNFCFPYGPTIFIWLCCQIPVSFIIISREIVIVVLKHKFKNQATYIKKLKKKKHFYRQFSFSNLLRKIKHYCE